MTCAAVRKQLLGSECPDEPGPDEAGHLAGCAACRAWQARLVRLERQLPRLPVPACPPPAALMERVRGKAAPPPLPLVLPTALPEGRRRPEWGRQKVALAFSLAATLTLFTVGWWAWPHGSEAPVKVHAPDQWAVQRDRVLRQVPDTRAGSLVKLGGEVLEQVSLHGDSPRKAERLAEVFEQLIPHDLLESARQLTPSRRREVLLDVAQRLTALESMASRLANDWGQRGVASAASASRIAHSARVALRALPRV